jgi:hypothetical protein
LRHCAMTAFAYVPEAGVNRSGLSAFEMQIFSSPMPRNPKLTCRPIGLAFSWSQPIPYWLFRSTRCAIHTPITTQEIDDTVRPETPPLPRH